MDLEKHLKNLNQLPEDRVMKEKIYKNIYKKTKEKRHFSPWKESILFVAIVAIVLFLIVTPSIPEQRHAATTVQEIYKYFGGEEGKFYARSSRLYLNSEKIENPEVLSFFENYQSFVTESDGKLGEHIADVIIIRNGIEERYQVSDTGMLQVSTGTFFRGDNEVYENVFNILYSPDINFSWSLLLAGVSILVNAWSVRYYKRHQLEEVDFYKRYWWIFIIVLGIIAGISAYGMWIGPIYKPFIIFLTLLFGLCMRHIIKISVQSYRVYKIERIKLLFIITAMIVYIILL